MADEDDDDAPPDEARLKEDRSDRELLERWRAGDQAAGSKLFERHFMPLMRFFRNKIDRGIEDLIQETMLACVRNRDRLRDDGSFRAYLFGTARYQLYEHVRKKNRGEPVDGEQQSFADLGPGPSTAYAKHREQQILLQALRKLPIDQQIALELYYWEGLSRREIAEIIGIPIPTAAQRIKRGSDKLKELVAQLTASPELVQSTVLQLGDWLAKLRSGSGKN